jgi:hypothetical protein
MAATFPVARWLALGWMLVWFPAYGVAWGWQNFLLFCDVAVILTCAGLWRGHALLLSSQALGLLFNVLWTFDLLTGALLGKHFFGGTEYMLDAQFPLGVRLLSFFHVLLPGVQIWALRRTGYDQRAWAFQSLLTFALMLVCLLLRPEKNLNYIYTEPLFGRAWGPAPVHLLVVGSFIALVVYLPTHLLLRKFLPPRMPRDAHG